MTTDEMITKFRNMVDDRLDEDFEFQLLNDAVSEIETMVVWEILKKKTSTTSLTTSLPTRFLDIIKITQINSTVEYSKILMEEQDLYTSSNLVYYLDVANNNLVFLSTPTTTVNIFYTQSSEELGSGDTWGFPVFMHKAVPIKMAELYYFADAGERSRSWDDKWTIQYDRALARGLVWNDRLKTVSRKPQIHYANPKGVEV